VVHLDPLDLSHVDGLLAAAGEDRGSYGYTLVPATAEEMHSYVLSALEDERTGWALPFAISLSDSERIVGSTRFLDLAYWTNPMSWPPGRPSTGGQGIPSVAEIGSTWIAGSVQRTGTNTEAKLLMFSHAFETWGVARVTLKTDARNERSRRAIERIGATFEGIRRAHVPATDGSIRDTAYYSILQVEWPAIQSTLVARLGRSAG
jgi:RimJ/RimL family protein N-acetyltransferase